MQLTHPNMISSIAQRDYHQNPTIGTLRAYMTELFQGDMISETVELLVNHIDQFGLNRELVILSDKLFTTLKPIFTAQPRFFDCRLDIIKLLVAVRNFWSAATVLEQAPDHHAGIDIDPLRTWLFAKWKPYMGARRFINPKYTLEAFFDHINQRQIRYVLLRWFDTLPRVMPGEDIDFLVDDRDLESFNTFLVPYGYNNAQKIDVYTPTGQSGTAYNDVPYYQANLAHELLNKRILFKNKYFVPSPRHHLMSLAYHVAYHKAENSGLPTSSTAVPTGSPDHDYQSVLHNLCHQSGITQPEYTLDGLHDWLNENGWSPSIDLIRKYGQIRQGWLSSLYPRTNTMDGRKGALCVFVLRERGLRLGLYEILENALMSAGFEILYHTILSENAKQQASTRLRGGNWGHGPFPQSGGFPVAAFVVYDHMPKDPGEKQKTQHPFLNNRLSLKIKTAIRDLINQDLPAEQHFNPLHSCDDDTEAWEYIDILFKDQKRIIRGKLDKTIDAFRSTHPVISDATEYGRRAKVELVHANHSHCIRKTYKTGRERYMDRELFAYGTLFRKIPYIPRLIDQGENWILIEHILENQQHDKGALIFKHLHHIFDYINLLFAANYAHLDFHPGNILFTADEKMYVIDYEFLHVYAKKPATVMESFDIAGYPVRTDFDQPNGGFEHVDYLWRKYTNHSLLDLMRMHLRR